MKTDTYNATWKLTPPKSNKTMNKNKVMEMNE